MMQSEGCALDKAVNGPAMHSTSYFVRFVTASIACAKSVEREEEVEEGAGARRGRRKGEERRVSRRFSHVPMSARDKESERRAHLQ